MLFNSIIFLIFLPIVFCGYWFVFRKTSIQNFFIVISSYFFYGWWDWRFLFLIFFTTCTCYFSGLLIQQSAKMKKKIVCGVNIAINIGILGFFKYFNFFSENINLLFSQFGYQLDWVTLDILLPVGISFYTFQAISYPIDVYKNQIPATHNFIAFASFISFFPQLVAGPIEKSTQLLPQFLKERRFNYSQAVEGMRQILWGFFKKIVIADNCAFIANKIFENYQDCNTYQLILGAIAFSFQIYGDFSGYSDIAIGVAKIFGINLKNNFHYPYFSRNIVEFWRRWHISLNSWFRDYVYIPLGGKHCSKTKWVRNILIVFLLSGLWHGPNWTFIFWGVYCGVLYLLFKSVEKDNESQSEKGVRHCKFFLTESLSIIVTFILVTIGWIIFRSENIADGFNYILYIFSHGSNKPSEVLHGYMHIVYYTSLMILILLLMEWGSRKFQFGLCVLQGSAKIVRWGTYFTLLFFILIFAGHQTDFIYFMF